MEGEIRLDLGGSTGGHVESCFRKALGCAREQGAAALELRAALSLARWLAAQGRRRDAHEILSGVYHALSEGADTPDHCSARGLLESLA